WTFLQWSVKDTAESDGLTGCPLPIPVPVRCANSANPTRTLDPFGASLWGGRVEKRTIFPAHPLQQPAPAAIPHVRRWRPHAASHDPLPRMRPADRFHTHPA